MDEIPPETNQRPSNTASNEISQHLTQPPIAESDQDEEPRDLPMSVVDASSVSEERATERVATPVMLLEPNLVSATISFFTRDNNKDPDTHITVTVRELGGTIAARIASHFDKFNDQTNNGPFTLVVTNASGKSKLHSGSVSIRIDAGGNDEWAFNFFLDLEFSDGSHLTSAADGIRLFAENRNQATFGIA